MLMSTLERAIEIAAKAHTGQVDKAGQPYILHPLRVMLRVNSADERIAAVLHDAVEDTDVTLELLAEEGSHMLRSMTEAQVIVHLPSTKRTWRTGEPVEVLHLPHHSNERLA